MNDSEKHLVHYVILIAGLAVFLMFFIFFWYNKETQLMVSALACLYYAGWGMIHHTTEDRLTKIIALEYILMALFVFTILFTALKL